MDRELDTWLRRQEEQIRRFGAIEAKIDRSAGDPGQGPVPYRGAAGHPQQIEDGTAVRPPGAHRPRASRCGRAARASSWSTAGLHAVSERVADLRERGEGVRGAVRRARCRQPGRRGGAGPGAQRWASRPPRSRRKWRGCRGGRRVGSLRQDAERLEAIAAETAAADAADR